MNCFTSCRQIKILAIDTYKENVAYLHRNCPLYRSEGFQVLNKIEITNGIDTTDAQNIQPCHIEVVHHEFACRQLKTQITFAKTAP